MDNLYGYTMNMNYDDFERSFPMSFFDDVINTTKSAAATAGKKTDEAVKFTKLKIKESQTTGDIKSHFEKLGEIAYEMKKNQNNDTEAFEAEVEELDKLYEKLAEINTALDELRQEVTCPTCGAKTKNENAFCPKCGTKLPQKPAPEPEEQPAEVLDEKKDEEEK